MAALILVAGGHGAAAAPPSRLPAGWNAHNLKPISYVQVRGPRAFKLSIAQHGKRWFLFVATGPGANAGFDVIDVTDTARPVVVASALVPEGNGQLTHHGNLLIAAQNTRYGKFTSYDTPFEGVPPAQRDMATLFDVSDPLHPKRLSSWKAFGWGSHRNVYPGGRYAYMSAWVAGYRGQSTLRIVDVSDPANPKDVGGWWQPGQRDDESPRASPTGYHGPANLSADGKMLTLGYAPSLVNLDITDPAKPRLIGKLDFAPLPLVGAQAVHTALPLDGGLVHVNTEPSAPGCDKESAHFSALVDNSDPAHPRLVSYYPRPTPPPASGLDSFCKASGRFGPHNVNGETHLAEVARPGPVIFQTYFNAGLRMFDVSRPETPAEIGWFIPPSVNWTSFGGERGPEDVLVDTRGIIYTSDGATRGVWILTRLGRGAPARPSKRP